FTCRECWKCTRYTHIDIAGIAMPVTTCASLHPSKVAIQLLRLLLCRSTTVRLVVEDLVLVELKSVERLMPIHYAHTLYYLQLLGMRCALLIIFNGDLVKYGVRRLIKSCDRPRERV